MGDTAAKLFKTAGDHWKNYLRHSSKYLIFLKNERLAQAVVQKTKHSYLGNNGQKWIFEASPGKGVLTKELLKSGAQKVRVFENFEQKYKDIDDLKAHYGEKLEIIDKQILDLSITKYIARGMTHEEFARECFKDSPLLDETSSKKEEEAHESSIVFYGCLSPTIVRSFISYLQFALANRGKFFHGGVTEFYLFIPVTILKFLYEKPGKNMNIYGMLNVIHHTLFDNKLLQLDYDDGCKDLDIPQYVDNPFSVFDPKCFRYINNKGLTNNEGFVLLWMKPKDYFYDYDCQFWINYRNFVKQSFSKPTNVALKYYEAYFPECTIDLIGLGISYFKQIGSLDSEEMFKIFKHLYNTEQYNSSIFKVNG